HESELAADHVKVCVLRRNLLRHALAPIHAGCKAAGHRQHAGIAVEACHACATLSRRPRQHAGAAGDVEHALSAADVGGVAEPRRPVGEDSGHKELFIYLGSIAGELAGIERFHRWSPRMLRRAGSLALRAEAAILYKV